MPYGKVKKYEKTTKLSNFRRNHNVSVLFPQLKYLNNIGDSVFQHELISTVKNNDDLQSFYQNRTAIARRN